MLTAVDCDVSGKVDSSILYLATELTPLQTATNQSTEQPHSITTISSTVPTILSEHPVARGESDNFEVVVATVACAVAILVIMVVITIVILVVMVIKRAKLGKRVMTLGNTSPIDNPSYIIGR